MIHSAFALGGLALLDRHAGVAAAQPSVQNEISFRQNR
jgi:hypothetical protein